MGLQFKKLNIDDVFDFGMYCGIPIRKVAEIDADYVLWCHDNIPSFILSETAYDYVYYEYCGQTLVKTIEYGDYMVDSLSIY